VINIPVAREFIAQHRAEIHAAGLTSQMTCLLEMALDELEPLRTALAPGRLVSAALAAKLTLLLGLGVSPVADGDAAFQIIAEPVFIEKLQDIYARARVVTQISDAISRLTRGDGATTL
jgi:hypothetical protein